MAKWPRVIKRGPLKGTYYESEREYRRDLSAVVGKTRYQQRNERARAMGYRSYSERRKVKETGIDERAYLSIKKSGDDVATFVQQEKSLLGRGTTKQRKERVQRFLSRMAREYPELQAWHIWAALYHNER